MKESESYGFRNTVKMMKMLFLGDLLCSFQCMSFILAPKRKRLKLSCIIRHFLPLSENDEIEPKFTQEPGMVLTCFRHISFIRF